MNIQLLTCVEYPLFNAMLATVPKLPGLGFVFRTFFFAEDQHDRTLQTEHPNKFEICSINPTYGFPIRFMFCFTFLEFQ